MVRNKALSVLAALGIGSGASVAAAQNMYGSDTLFQVTTDALASCVAGGLVPSGSIVYKGTGSGQGGKAMGAGDASAVPPIPALNQEISPQSRFLSASECAVPGGAANTGDGVVIGLDGISIATASTPANTCNTLKYNGASLDGFTFNDWRDVLRVIYTGQSSKVTTGGAADSTGCTLTDPSATPSAPGAITDATNTNATPSASATTRCDSQLRRDLISSWPNMFQDTCANGNCTALRHAWRRDDASGTTDTFLTLLGLPKATVRTFCNGYESEDLDPVRTACNANEQVCSTIPYKSRNADPNGGAPAAGQAAANPGAKGGDLGVVLAITIPTNAAVQYGTACTIGKFSLAPMPFSASLETQRCPDGNARQGNKCRFPYAGNAVPPAGQFNCLANISTVPGAKVFTNMDGRAYNLVPRDPATGVIQILPSTGTTIPDLRWGGGGVYRIHQTVKMANADAAATACAKSDATDQIGCLAGADPCSIGYAGQESLKQPVVKGLKLRSPSSGANQAEVGTAVGDDSVILKLLADCTTDASSVGVRYALSRKLYINSSRGLGNVDDTATVGGVANEAKFMTCVRNRANGFLDNAVNNAKFIRIPGFAGDTTSAAYPTRACPP